MFVAQKTSPRVSGGRGLWFRARNGVHLYCPKCSEPISLAEHEIDSEGVVTPTVECPTPECGLDATVRLLRWDLSL
jgi:ribosomal protein S27AE